VNLGTAAVGRDNNFNLIRLLAAAGVLVSHAYPIMLGADAAQPLHSWLGVTLGSVSVFIFFSVSGFLISQSFVNTSTLGRWTTARVLRIFPGLAVVLILTALLLGPMVTTLSTAEYFGSTQTLTYLPRNLTLFQLQYPLPGVFEDNAYPRDINGSLWTLQHEVMCYAGVAVIGLLGAFRSARMAGALLVLGAVGATLIGMFGDGLGLPLKLVQLGKLGLPFIIGALFYVFRDRIVLKAWIAILLVAATAVSLNTVAFTVVFAVALTYVVFYLAYVPGGAIRQYNRLGDYSYGLYIYAFPVQQMLAHVAPGLTPVQSIMIALPVTLAFAIPSWYLVEKPALALKTAIAGRSKPTAEL